jgi:hypothetical protein
LYNIEKAFRSAHDFANSETGAGLLATDNVATFDKLIEKRCMYYEELLPIFQGRASARAKIMKSNLDDATDEYGDEDEEIISPKDDTTVATATLLANIRGENTMNVNQSENNEESNFYNNKENNIPVTVNCQINGVDEQSIISNDDNNKKKKFNSRPISINSGNGSTTSSSKKPKNIPYEYAMSDYRNKKAELAVEAADEVRRHNRAMESIALTTADIEKTKKNIEMGAIAQSAQVDFEKKSLELRIQKWNTFTKLKDRGMTDSHIIQFFPALKEFIIVPTCNATPIREKGDDEEEDTNAKINDSSIEETIEISE